MALRSPTARVRRPARPDVGYRRILVPVVPNLESERAIGAACRLADEHGASITVVVVVEVPSLLPLDAQMVEEESEARALLRRAAAIGESYGVRVATRVLRAREAATAIVEEIEATGAELLVIGAARRPRARRRGPIFGGTVEIVLKKARCRVLVVATPARA